jgi:hypothetical protein
MIAMGLLFLMLLYIVFFIVVGLSAKRWATRLFGWGILLAPLVWKTWDIPVGYYHFQNLCETEAGFKIFIPNPAPARIIRLDSYSYTHLYAEEILAKRPSVVAVEAKDKKFNYLSKPVAFAYYERNTEGKVISRLIDEVGNTLGSGDIRVLKSSPSSADYIVTQSLDYPGNRVSRWRQELRYKDGTVIASSTSLDYMWSNPANTLFAQSFHTDRCGSWELADALIDLVAPHIN